MPARLGVPDDSLHIEQGLVRRTRLPATHHLPKGKMNWLVSVFRYFPAANGGPYPLFPPPTEEVRRV